MGSGKKQFIFWSLVIFVPICLISGSILFYIYRKEAGANTKIIRTEETAKIKIQEHILANAFREVIGDLRVISSQHGFQSHSATSGADLSGVLNDFFYLSRHKGLYDQVRYLDRTGMEIVRINYNGGAPSVVKRENLQNKAGRYYFRDTIRLNKDEVFISPLDLNIEHGQIERPYKPMIRFGTPIVDRNGSKQGICLLNYSAGILIADLEQIGGKGLGTFSFLNAQGYRMTASEDRTGWGFMFEDRKTLTFGSTYPLEWKRIVKADSGQIQSENGLFTFATFYPLGDGHVSSTGSAEASASGSSLCRGNDYFFKLVSHVPKGVLLENAQRIFTSLFQFFLVLNLFFLAGALIFAKFIADRKAYKSNLARERVEEEKLRGVIEMAGAVSHEITQPLMILSGYAELLLEDLPETSPHYDNALNVKKQADRLGRMSHKLTRITRYRTRAYLDGSIIDLDRAAEEK